MTIEEMIKILDEMSISVTTLMIHDGMKIGRAIIAVMVGIMTMIIHHKEIMVTDNHIEEVIIKQTESLITFDAKMK